MLWRELARRASRTSQLLKRGAPSARRSRPQPRPRPRKGRRASRGWRSRRGAEPEEPAPPPPLRRAARPCSSCPRRAEAYESENEEAEEEEEEEQPEAEEGPARLVESRSRRGGDPAVAEARLQAKRERAFERKVKALADAAPDALLAETVVAFCNEAVESGRGFCVGGYPRTLAQAELLEQAFHPDEEEDAAPTWDGLVTIKREPADDDAAAPAPAPQEGDAEAEEAQQAAEAAEAERLEAERVVDEIASAANAAIRLTWAPDHLIRLEERVAACVCVLEDYEEADTPAATEEVEQGDKTLLEKAGTGSRYNCVGGIQGSKCLGNRRSRPRPRNAFRYCLRRRAFGGIRSSG